MSNFTKEQENYIHHEVLLRLHETKFNSLENDIDKLDRKLDKSIERLDVTIEKLGNKIEASIKHLDNKCMIMFSIIIGCIWLPAILHYLHLT
jgi:hypothetical protein